MDSLTRCVSKLQEDVKFLIYAVGYLDGLVQDCSNSIPNALELLQSCTKLLIYDCELQLLCAELLGRKKYVGHDNIIVSHHLFKLGSLNLD